MTDAFDSRSTFNYPALVNIYRFTSQKTNMALMANGTHGRKRHDCTVSCDGSGRVTEPLVTASKAEVVFGGEKHLLESRVSRRICGQTRIPCILDPKL